MGQSFVGFPEKELPSSVGMRSWEAAEIFPTEKWKCHLPGSMNSIIRAGWGMRTGPVPDKQTLASPIPGALKPKVSKEMYMCASMQLDKAPVRLLQDAAATSGIQKGCWKILRQKKRLILRGGEVLSQAMHSWLVPLVLDREKRVSAHSQNQPLCPSWLLILPLLNCMQTPEETEGFWSVTVGESKKRE